MRISHPFPAQAYATALSYVLKIKAALGSRDKAPKPVTAEAVEEPVAV